MGKDGIANSELLRERTIMSKNRQRDYKRLDTISPVVDIVIPVFNRFDILHDCLETLSTVTRTLVFSNSCRQCKYQRRC